MSSALTFGVLINEIEGTYQSLIMRGLIEAAGQFGVNLLCFPGHIPADRMAFEREFNVVYRLARCAPLDGLIVAPQTFDRALPEGGLTRLIRSFGDLPVVCMGTRRPGLSSFTTDHHAGMAALVDHFLHDHGYRRIAFMRGSIGDTDADARYAAFVQRHEAAGVPIDPALVLDGRFSPHTAAEVADAFFDQGIACDALISANDEMALAVMSRALRRGIRIPEELAIAGYDDVTGQSGVPVPLTSVDQDVPGVARRAMQQLVRSVRERGVPVSEEVSPKLRLRSSCGCRGDEPAQRFGQMWADTQRGELVIGELSGALRHDLQAGEAAAWRADDGLSTEFDERLRRYVVNARARQGSMADLRTAVQQLSRLFLAEAEHRPREWERAVSRKLLDAQTLLHEQGQTFQAEDTLRRHSRARTIWWTMQQMAQSGTYRLEQIMPALQRGLIQLGARNALVVLYPEPLPVDQWETFEPPPELVFATGVVHGEPVAHELLGRFPLNRFLPVSPFDGHTGMALSVFPLFLQSRQFGYLVLDTTERLDTLFEHVRADVSSLITSSALIGELSRARELLHEDLGRQQMANRQLTHLALRDEMTGQLNRRGFFASIDQLRHDDPGHDAVLWLIDLDGLKQINDRHGHAAGDSALRSAAHVLEAAFRGSDLVARLGGDEFAVFNYPASSETQHSVETRLQRMLHEHNQASGRPWTVAFSLGHCLLEAREGSHIDDVFALADRRLYANKRERKAKAAAAAAGRSGDNPRAADAGE